MLLRQFHDPFPRAAQIMVNMHQPYLVYITRKCHAHILSEETAEILPAQIKMGCDLLQRYFLRVMFFNIGRHLRQTFQNSFIVHRSCKILRSGEMVHQFKKHLHSHSLALQAVTRRPGHIQGRQTL